MSEHELTITALCEEAVRRLARALPGVEIGCLFRYDDTLRHLAHAGELGLIYEIAQEQGGVAWRAAEQGETQLVEDVRADPDYLASDAGVRSEVAAPITVAGAVVGVIDVEFPGRVFDAGAAAAIEAEAARLGDELAPYVS